MSATSYVVVRIMVASRPPGRLCRTGTGGRDRSDPHFSMPGVASGRVGMCTPSQPSPGVAPSPSVLCRKASARSKRLYSDLAAGVTSATVSLSASPRCPTVPPTDWAAKPSRRALRSGRRLIAVSGPRSLRVAGASDSGFARGQANRPAPLGQRRQSEEDRLIRRRHTAAFRMAFPQGYLVRERPLVGKGRACENTLGAMPHRALGEGGRYRHAPARSCATGNRAAGPQDVAVPLDRQDGRCASPEGQDVNRPPLSFSHSSPAVSRSVGHRPTYPQRQMVIPPLDVGWADPPKNEGRGGLKLIELMLWRGNAADDTMARGSLASLETNVGSDGRRSQEGTGGGSPPRVPGGRGGGGEPVLRDEGGVRRSGVPRTW